jgi:hypothetical protein
MAEPLTGDTNHNSRRSCPTKCGLRPRWLVDDEELRTERRGRSVRPGIVGNLVTDAGSPREGPPVLKLDVELALETEEDVSFRTPMVNLM